MKMRFDKRWLEFVKTFLGSGLHADTVLRYNIACDHDYVIKLLKKKEVEFEGEKDEYFIQHLRDRK